jgi:hypothetical protein
MLDPDIPLCRHGGSRVVATPEVELDAAQALFAARMFEAAVHHPGPWTFQWGSIEVPAIASDGSCRVKGTGRNPDFPEKCGDTPGGHDMVREVRPHPVKPGKRQDRLICRVCDGVLYDWGRSF